MRALELRKASNSAASRIPATGFSFAPSIAFQANLAAIQDDPRNIGPAPLRGKGDAKGETEVRIGSLW